MSIHRGILAAQLCLAFSSVTAQELSLQVQSRSDAAEISSTEIPGATVLVDKSQDLQAWRELAVFEWQAFAYKDQHNGGSPAFYRARATNWFRGGIAARYANQLKPYSRWLGSQRSSAEPRWVKFVIDLTEPEKIYFHLDHLHYSFVTDQLPGFVGISPQDFEKVALVRTGQRLLLGTIFFSPEDGPRNEAGIQFVGNEPYPAEFIVQFINRVKDRIANQTPMKFFYMPEYEQVKAAQDSAAYLLAHGIENSSLARWTMHDVSYSSGWAVGRLKYFPAGQIQNAYRNGLLTADDILLTDFTPAEIPRVAGIITLNPSSPGSHVAILARADETPYVYLASEDLRAQAQALIGKEILLRADVPTRLGRDAMSARGSDFIRLIDITSQPALLADVLQRAKPIEPLNYQVKETAPFFSMDTKDIQPEHFKYFGGKATHFGLLRRTITTNSPDAIAISFNLWDEFVRQEIVPGQTLRSAIDVRLERGTTAQNPALLADELEAIRDLIKDATFTEGQRTQVLNALARFDSQRNIRFRSSSNVEDSDTFIAAGLYDSYSGCVLDDLDSDNAGPSVCDPTEDEERGVFRAIKKVYASFYNDGAFFERRRRSVKEHEVGMALLVHHSFPDEIERANGVVLLTYTRGSDGSQRKITWVRTSQVGALSVTNPEGEAIPEILGDGDNGQFVHQRSSLLPMGAGVLSSADSETLKTLLIQTAETYAALHPEKASFLLDYEFKLDPNGIVIKQIREVPVSANRQTFPICFGEDVEFRTLQTGTWDLWGAVPQRPFAVHYAKSTWRIRVGPFEMTPEPVARPFYTNVIVHVPDNDQIRRFEGSLATLPGYKHSFSNNVALDEWSFTSGGPIYQLKTTIPTNSTGIAQVQTIRDWWLELTVKYPENKTCITFITDSLPYTNRVYYTNTFTTELEPTYTTNQTSLPIFRTWTRTNDWQIRSDYFWARMPETAFGGAGYTSPLVDWQGTTLTGFTDAPIQLRGFFSQSYGPKRKNMYETYVFDPWLEPGIPEATLQQLRAANIRLIYCGGDSKIGLLGLDGTVRFEDCARDGKPGYPSYYDR